MLLAGMAIFLSSGCKNSDFQKYSDSLGIAESSFNLVVTTSLDCDSCIDRIIFNPRSPRKYYGLIYSSTKQKSLSDFSYAEETWEWITWQIIDDGDLFVSLLDFSEDRQTPLLFEIENGKLKHVQSIK
jgi:hypothetical protein